MSEAEAEMAASPQRDAIPSLSEEVMACARDCIVLLDADGAILDANPAARAAMDLGAKDEAKGRAWRSLWPDELSALVDQTLSNARGGARATAMLFQPSKKATAPVWWHVTVSPIADAAHPLARFLVSAHRLGGSAEPQGEHSGLIAEQRAALVALARQLADQAERLSDTRKQVTQSEKVRLLGQFVGNVVHDINNVLAVMSSASRLLRSDQPPEMPLVLEHVDAAIERGAKLVRQLLDFSRTDKAPSDVVRLDRVLSEDEGLLRHLAGCVTIDFQYGRDTWPVIVSRGRLQAVIFNLVANARDAMPDGGTLTIRVENRRANERPLGVAANDYVVMSFADTGKGMPPEVLKRAGEPFYTTKGKGEGSGLGLASAYSLAEQVGGVVRIDSAPGKGTRVALYLPRAAFSDGERPQAESGEAELHGDARILLAENDQGAREALAALLRAMRYTVSEAETPEQALAEMLANSPDLIVWSLDPVMRTGLPLLQSREDIAAPCIFTSTSGGPLPAGEIVLRKPVTEDLLSRAVLEKLGRVRPRIAIAEALRTADRVRDKIRGDRVRTIYELWRSVIGEKMRLPVLAEARIFETQDSPEMFLVEVSANSFRFIRVGRTLVERFGSPLEGQILTDDANAIGFLGGAYKRCLGGVAHYDYSRMSLGEGKLTLFERLVLPISDNNLTVTHLCGIATFADIEP